MRYLGTLLLSFLLGAATSSAQDLPYFIAYSHHMEEPGSLELESLSVTGRPADGNRFGASTFSLEYGVTAWWTAELYLEGQTTGKESTVFTGYRLENRIRPLLRERWINPVLYFEFEDINGANKSLREVVGHDGVDDLTTPNAEARTEKKRELELKLILSKNWKGWNFSQNTIVEKDVRHAPWEFGYALAASRPLRLEGSVHPHAYSLQNFSAGGELYGGLGDRDSFGLHETSHYFGPSLNWSNPNGLTITASPNFGLNSHSVDRLYRFGLSYEISQFSRLFTRGDR